MEIEKTKAYVEEFFKGNHDGHDYYHILRVYNLATKIAKEEQANLFVVQMAALLHDIDDTKLVEKQSHNAITYLNTLSISQKDKDHIMYIIENQSYRKSIENKQPLISIEAKIVQDADRLDSMGAIGIARTFAYGGSKKRDIYNPNIKPIDFDTEESYAKTTNPSINHFYEKLLKLKNLMNTKTAKKMAAHRHRYMESFLEEFYAEWEGNQ